MNIILVLILMLFMHIVDDYYMQGILAKMKQKDWWYSEYTNLRKMYEKDHIIALIMHAFSWSVSILLPIFFATNWNPHWLVYLMILANCIIHSIVDDLKANKKKLNLIQDQFIHIMQIVITWIIWILIGV